ncbi:MAG: immunity 22 family protein [Proteobacteria bacterium]|nr:immunity 22 family protein [Pseudomonadota bacterium]
MRKIDDRTPEKISVWVGTTHKSRDEFNAYFEGLEDSNSNCGIHRDFGCAFIDTDFFFTFGTANNEIVPIEKLCEEVGCSSRKTENAIIEKCHEMGIHEGNVGCYYGNATFTETDANCRYNDMIFIGTFDDPRKKIR